MRGARLPLAVGALASAASALAQPVARSPAPQSVAVTVYRAPNRGASDPIDLRWLNGYAFITERRRVAIPAGESDIRFEGVSGGILPQSAIVAGLPGDVVEKNQDAWLLSPASLVDATLGKRVHLRRTAKATGVTRDMEAVVRSGPDGAVVIQTAEGVEALRCSGLRETLAYDKVPPRLSAKPTLSVRVRSPRAVTATITLSYLASDFDWQANYVAELAPDGNSMNLFAWLTLASGDETSFVRADTQAVAGRLNRNAIRARRAQAPPLVLRCWPSGTTTSGLREEQFEREEEIVVSGRMASMAPMPPPPSPPPPPPPPPPPMAQQEDLGDFKLYRIPMPVTVAARSQKQVALLARQGIKVETVYRSHLYMWQPSVLQGVSRLVKTRNLAADGLGLPLPSGPLAMFAGGRQRPMLLGRGSIDDKAVGEDVEIHFGRATAIQIETKSLSPTGAQQTDWELTATNTLRAPARFELVFYESGLLFTPETALSRRNGNPIWALTIAPGERVALRYRVEKR